MRLVFLSLAVEDLASIRSYIADDNPEAAQKVAFRLKQIIKKLAVMPNIGKSGRVFGTRELVTPKIGKTVYVVVYRVKETRLEILRILPGMQAQLRLLYMMKGATTKITASDSIEEIASTLKLSFFLSRFYDDIS